MAQLFRVSKSHDISESQTFTFLLPPATATEYPPEILSRDFTYAGHKWRISLLKQDRHLSPFLQKSNVSEGLRCVIDFTFILVHRQSFTDSEQYSEKQREFNWRASSHGCRTFVTLDDLSKRQFTDSRGEYIFEVVLKNPRTTFEQIFTLNVPVKPAVADSRHSDARDYQRYDTNPFNFGDQEWVCVFCPNFDTTDKGAMRHMVQLNRRSRSDMLCKLRYRILLGRQQVESCCLRSENREEIFDFSGNGEAFYFVEDYFLYTYEGNRLLLTIELNSISFVNLMKLNVLSLDKRPVAQCFDRDRQTWCITTTPAKRRRSRPSIVGTDVENQDDPCMSLTLLYPDVQNIPRDYLRFICWSLHIVPSGKKRGSLDASQKSCLTAIGAPFEHYYSQLDTDNGFIMKTKLTLEEIREDSERWLDNVDQRLTVQLEWLGSYLLLHAAYHAYDDVYRKHILQMRREVQALQAENNTLEKQVHDYQLAVTGKGSETPPRPRTASASSHVGMAATPVLAGHHRNSATVLEGAIPVAGVDTRRPPRSSSGLDVRAISVVDPARPSTPTHRAASRAESGDLRDGISQYTKAQQRAVRAEDELVMREGDNEHEDAGHGSPIVYSPCSSPPLYESRGSVSRSGRIVVSNAPYYSPTRRRSQRHHPAADVCLLPGEDRSNLSISRAESARSPSGPRRHRASLRGDNLDDDYSLSDRPYVRTDRALHPEVAGGGPLVRSKSASPYPQRQQSSLPGAAYWRAETPTSGPSDDDAARVYKPPPANQLKPEPTRFGDEEFNRRRNRSFRVNHQKDRKMSGQYQSHHYGKEAEDIDYDSYYR